MTLAATVVGRTLAELGVRQVFGVVGSGNFHVTNALVDGGARFVAARHENGAATMADAYARMSGTVAALSVHQGCGLTNALTGITEAAKSRTPLVVLAAEATSPLSNFHVDQRAIAAAVGAIPRRLTSPEAAAAEAAAAYWTARDERRTVVLNLPLDVQAAEVAGSPVRPAEPPVPDVPIDAEGVGRLVDALAAARRPVFIAGRGRAAPAAGKRWSVLPSGPGPCWRRARSPTACSRATPGRSGSAAASRRPWRASCCAALTSSSAGAAR